MLIKFETITPSSYTSKSVKARFMRAIKASIAVIEAPTANYAEWQSATSSLMCVITGHYDCNDHNANLKHSAHGAIITAI